MPVHSDPGSRDVVDTLVGFARTLRAAGLTVASTRVHTMIEAVDQLGAGSSDAVYWAGRLTLCASREDVGRYDQVFAAYFSGRRPKPVTRTRRPAPVRDVAIPAGVDVGTLGSPGDAPRPERTATASRLEVLRHRDVSELSARDRAEVHRWVSALRPGGPERITRRRRAARRGVVDPHRTVRAMLRHGGEPARLRRHDHSAKPRRLVLLIDVSGSMALYSDTLLRFAHAACRARPGTEVFTVGTRLTRVTRELSQRDPLAAMTAVSESILDWSGGTRLGDELKEFLDRWGQRGTARGAVVVVASDGWERGDATLLGEQMARLHRLSRRVVWVNPHRGRDGYVPRTGGMLAALPYIDRLVAGHSLGALEELADLLQEDGRRA